jgi:RNA polymerase sigma-70 factor, ECF subfamily
MACTIDDFEKIVELYNLYEQKMYHVACSILHDTWQAEDAVQEAYIKLINNINQLNEPDSYETKKYIIMITKNTAIDIYRKNQRAIIQQTAIEEDFWICNSQHQTYSLSSEFEEDNDAYELIKQLPEIYRDVLQKRSIEQLSVKDTAAVLQIRENTVRKRYERGIKRLKKLMGGKEYDAKNRSIGKTECSRYQCERI